MKVQICIGTKCSFYGATNILDSVEDLKETLHELPNIREDADIEIELVPCYGECKGENSKIAPVVVVDGEKIERASSPVVMEKIMKHLMVE